MLSNMSSRVFPSDPNADDMANNWGTQLVETMSGPCVPRHRIDSEIRIAVPGFRLLNLFGSGTCANERAMSIATDAHIDRCLIAMGSYVGGAPPLENLTSTNHVANWQLSLVKDPDECTNDAKRQTVALPYHVPNSKLTEEDLVEHENKCLDALVEKLILAKLCGKGYRALLLEYILSGSGGILSDAFLKMLGPVLQRFGVIVIADEIMTGGRVGPMMAMTSSLPKEFVDSIGYITFGKCLGCGMVLERVSVYDHNKGRGTSTELCNGEAILKFKAITERLQKGFIETKKNKVLLKLRLTDDSEDIWGRGLLMFTSKCRSSILRCLKNCLLPRLEDNKKTKLQLGCKATKWTRSVVNKCLFNSARQWMLKTREYEREQLESPYLLSLARYIATKPSQTTICPEQLCEYIGDKDTKEMVDEYRRKKNGD